VAFREGVSSPVGGLGTGLCPPDSVYFGAQNSKIWCILCAIIYSLVACFTCKITEPSTKGEAAALVRLQLDPRLLLNY